MKKTFTSLLIAYLMSIVAGFLSILITLLLFSNYYGETDEILFSILGRTFLNFLIAFFLCLTVFLPISLFDKEKIQKSSFEEAIRRYSPIITLPLSILFCLVLFSNFSPSDYNFFITVILTTFCLSYVGLWTFIKRIKS